jgi:hypothetical protein
MADSQDTYPAASPFVNSDNPRQKSSQAMSTTTQRLSPSSLRHPACAVVRLGPPPSGQAVRIHSDPESEETLVISAGAMRLGRLESDRDLNPRHAGLVVKSVLADRSGAEIKLCRARRRMAALRIEHRNRKEGYRSACDRHPHFADDREELSTLWQRAVSRSAVSHEIPKIVDAIHHIRVLLNDVREGLGINECDRQLFVEGVVVPIHLCESQNTCTRLMPTTCARVPPKQQGGGRGLERSFFVYIVFRIIDMDTLHAALGPQERLIRIDGQVGSTSDGVAVRLRRSIHVKTYTLPINPFHNLDQFHICAFPKAVQRT